MPKRIPKHTKTADSDNNYKYNDHPKIIMGVASLNVVSKIIDSLWLYVHINHLLYNEL